MQIILIQAEIEQAIRNYMSEQINIKDSMTITIDLRSTRGAEGFTANIDISKKGYIPTIYPEDTVVKQLPAVIVTTPHVEQEAVKTITQEPVVEVKQEEPIATEEVVTETAPKKSLFGGLKKPVNDYPVTEE